MVRMLVSYYSRSGHTKAMAEEIARGARDAGAQVDLLNVEQVDVKGLKEYDAIILGSPTYYGTMAAPVKELIDQSVKLHGKLAGRVGGAFASSGMRAGGNETTVLDILKALLIHGMVVIGTSGEDHYGPVAIKAPDEKAIKSCNAYGRKLAELTQRLRG
jgi:NAD(P)H dehydrogenase (quinone)